jgi:hypothetical protein
LAGRSSFADIFSTWNVEARVLKRKQKGRRD